MDTTALKEFLADIEFSGVVLVRRGDQTLFEAASGLATQRWGVQNTLEMRFDTSAITKLFTSVAVLQQVVAGKLDLEASIHDYVDLDGTTIGRDVTLLHLLTHTSGLADDADEAAGEDYADLYLDTPNYSVVETRDLLRFFGDKEPLEAPGVESHYINAGYVLAGLALESVTGLSYRAYIERDVFAAAGMTSSGFFDKRDATANVAEGWDQAEDGSWEANIYKAPPIGGPDTGAHATAEDLLRFLHALRTGVLLNPEYTSEFFTPQIEHDEETSYGLGLEFDMNEDGSVRSYFKDGISAGASGILRHYLEEGIDVVVLSNAEEGAWDVIRELDERLGG
ncbi:CubicO group peptidase (beta-lactamase class C family) [Microterricola gilva]|uniref:CubicO group peptidase (Beta-lactamase class C family) n=1 Tax=Microterricola gilva TaxID=393267 RepID=A0A4V2GAD0_9MICO|nr:serine hydrolase domain-containing protein [Microterricola gilva]RZU63766.1 CubicO group peptidase (beta-lactamase class C family) [Microterricola gilva]